MSRFTHASAYLCLLGGPLMLLQATVLMRRMTGSRMMHGRVSDERCRRLLYLMASLGGVFSYRSVRVNELLGRQTQALGRRATSSLPVSDIDPDGCPRSNLPADCEEDGQWRRRT